MFPVNVIQMVKNDLRITSKICDLVQKIDGTITKKENMVNMSGEELEKS